MPNKNWDEMDDDEKLEVLREDIQRLFNFANALGGDVRRAWLKANEVDSKLSEVAKAVEELERRLPEKEAETLS